MMVLMVNRQFVMVLDGILEVCTSCLHSNFGHDIGIRNLSFFFALINQP